MPRADLFVVCKNPDCRAEVSPYVTECPYCGTRLRKRAPKLDRGRPPERHSRRPPMPRLARLRPNEIPGIRADRGPYATAALVLGTLAVWIATRGGYLSAGDLVVDGPLHGDWWRVLTAPFTYWYSNGTALSGTGLYQFLTLLVVGAFGWLLERRHGPFAVLLTFLVGAAAGTYAATVVDTSAVVAGGNSGALALICAWAVPDLLARRSGRDYDGDLLGVLALAVLMLAMPLARPEASAVAGGVGVVVGYGAGLLLNAAGERRG